MTEEIYKELVKTYSETITKVGTENIEKSDRLTYLIGASLKLAESSEELSKIEILAISSLSDLLQRVYDRTAIRDLYKKYALEDKI